MVVGAASLGFSGRVAEHELAQCLDLPLLFCHLALELIQALDGLVGAPAAEGGVACRQTRDRREEGRGGTVSTVLAHSLTLPFPSTASLYATPPSVHAPRTGQGRHGNAPQARRRLCALTGGQASQAG